MGIGSKISLVADIIRAVRNDKTSLQEIVDYLASQPLILGSDITSIVPLAKKFGFIEGEDGNLAITKQGLEFMKYVDTTSEATSKIASPVEANYQTLDKLIMDTGAKYKKDPDEDEQPEDSLNKQVFQDFQELRRLSSERFGNSPDPPSDYELLLTATMPPGIGQGIPQVLSGRVILHDEAVRKVIKDARRELYVSSAFIDANTFKLLVGNCYTGKISCKIITSDEDRLKNNLFKLKILKKFLDSHFLDGKIRYLRKTNVIAHAKIWLSEKSVHITSANILINSQVENFELGIYSTNMSLVNACKMLVEKVWEQGVDI